MRYRRHLFADDDLGLRLDISRVDLGADETLDAFLSRMEDSMQQAFDAMEALEAGAIANPDEQRQVGHYWLRAPDRAPDDAIRDAILEAIERVEGLAASVHDGSLRPERAARFTDFLVVGIGGSALGPQLTADALGRPATDLLRPHFFDNTDPDGMERTLEALGDRLESTLTIVISKSGGTKETRNGMLCTRSAYARRGLLFARHAVAITGEGSQLDRLASEQGWLARLPMWDWVGGRTSETSTVGLLPAALQGLDIRALLAGAAACDAATRRRDTARNPAARLALAWHLATDGRGARDMVILPYADRLLLFSRYLQQLIMESLGKATDLEGQPTAQGIAVYGNKGSTDQHAFVQQLREGVDNVFVTFIEVLETPFHEVEPGIGAGDYLRGFLLGTREALSETQRPSITLTVRRVDAYHLGVLIALYERAVGFYASLVGINAYHQPGVEAGKKAAGEVLALQVRAVETLEALEEPIGLDALAAALDLDAARTELLFHVLEGLAANGRIDREAGDAPTAAVYSLG
ncbi:MAG: glucose-6-phosphate isomerase [Acidobacteriota bacterium]